MFIFLRLLLAHFIGDFPLQFSSIYKLKHKGLWGIVPHALIVTVCGILFSWPYLHIPLMWYFIIFIGVTHLIQDSIKLNFGNPKSSFWTYSLDQLSHVGLIALVFLTDLKNLAPPTESANLLIRLYSNDKLVVYVIALILATYNGFYLIKNFKMTFLDKADRENSFEKLYGMGERAVIVSAFLGGGPFYFLLPIIALIRPIFFFVGLKVFRLHKEFISLTEIILTWTIGILAGLLLHLL